MTTTPAPEQLSRTCTRHGRKPAVTSCASCGAGVCRDCVVPTSVGVKCAACIGRPGEKAATAARRRRLIWSAAGGAALVALAVVATTLGSDDSGGSTRATAPILQGGAALRTVQFGGADDLKLAGALALPEGAASGSKLAGVVILAGYGPTNRNGVVAEGGVPDNLYRELSEAFADAEMVTLTYDKRGTGQSVLPESEPLRFEDLVTDAAAAVDFLAQRAEVDPERIAVVGHGEGGLVAMQLAEQEPRVRGLGLISVPGRPFVDVLADDFAGSAHRGEEVAGLRAVVASLLADGRLPADIPASLAGFFPAGRQEYLTDIFSLDPVALAREVDVPVLVVRGGAATFVTAADEAALRGALSSDEVFVAGDAGPTLLVQGAPLPDTEHAHDNIGVAPTRERSAEAVTRITQFLTRVTAA